MAGIPDEAIQKLLRHSSVRTTQEIYMHLTSHGEKRAADKMDEIFWVSSGQGSGQKRQQQRELKCKCLILWCARTDSNCRPSGS
jgi:hypothetical protein